MLFSGTLHAQRLNTGKLEASVQQAIAKAYRASVRIWGFDTVSQTRTSGQFTGVVVNAEGHLLTAAHVNVPGNTYRVMFPDGSSAIARGLGEIDLEATPGVPDVAMMKLVGKGNWPFAEMGWSYSLLKNQPCISIAYPESLDQPLPLVRFGYIYEPRNSYGFIQSTCLMEPGDSGGPLFDYSGRVIGLHSAIDVAENANFEVPVDLYRKYWTALSRPEAYTYYPGLQDGVGTDPMAQRLKAIPELVHPEDQFHLSKNLKAACLLISSNLKGKTRQVQGTLFSLEGIAGAGSYRNKSVVVSKSSMVGDAPLLDISGRQVVVHVLARDPENDLVLLQTDQEIKGGLKIKQLDADTVKFASLGKFLVSPLAKDSCRISVLGSMQFNLPKITSIGYLGVQVAYFGPMMFNSIQPGTPAIDAGLEKGDELLSLNGVSLKKRSDYVRESKKYWSDDKITVTVKRKDTVYTKEVMLTDKPELLAHHPASYFAGGKSLRHDGFSQVFAHDGRLKPEECGGPLFDRDGRFYGINIARFSRTCTIALPAKVVAGFITGKMVTVPDDAKTKILL